MQLQPAERNVYGQRRLINKNKTITDVPPALGITSCRDGDHNEEKINLTASVRLADEVPPVAAAVQPERIRELLEQPTGAPVQDGWSLAQQTRTMIMRHIVMSSWVSSTLLMCCSN